MRRLFAHILVRLGVALILLSGVGIYLAWTRPHPAGLFGPRFGMLCMIGAGVVGLVMVLVAIVWDRR
jgi:hypothetical protein